MSRTGFDTTRTSRAGFAALTSATRIIAAALALAAIGAAVALFVSQAGTPHTTAVVLVDSSGADATTMSTGTGTGASTPTSQAAPVYEGPPPQMWTRVTATVQKVPQTMQVTVTPRPAPCPTKLRPCEPVHF
jgi:hypothetical protein